MKKWKLCIQEIRKIEKHLELLETRNPGAAEETSCSRDHLREENEQMKRNVQVLTSQNGKLQMQIERLKRLNDNLNSIMRVQQEKTTELQMENEKLRKQITYLSDKLRVQRTEPPEITCGIPTDEEVETEE